jgi:hypothetical protein
MVSFEPGPLYHEEDHPEPSGWTLEPVFTAWRVDEFLAPAMNQKEGCRESAHETHAGVRKGAGSW